MERGFSPYVANGGTCVAVAGKDYCIVAADSRLSLGYAIKSRDCPKITQLTPNCCIASSGMQADVATLHKVLKMRVKMYEHQHGSTMTTTAIATNVSRTLYYKRFFPYYTFNIVAGLTNKGEGIVYSYDAIGTIEGQQYAASGTGSSMIEPFLDCQVGLKNQLQPVIQERSVEECLELIKDTFSSAGERDIYTGDSVDIYIITKDGTRHEKFELKKD